MDELTYDNEEMNTEEASVSEENENYQMSESATKRYSERLNKDSAKIKEEYESELTSYRDMENSLRELGYEGSNAAELNERLKEEIDKNIENTLPDDPIIYKALEIATMYKRAKDLEDIKKVYPDCNATDPREIGEIFTKIMQSGQIDALTAYEAQLAYNKRNAVEATVSMGKISSPGAGYEKDYYSPEEAAKLTRKDYDKNPGLWDKVRNSMLKW